MPRTADVHLTIPKELLAELDGAARERGLRRVQFLREVIVDHLRRRKAERVAREMAGYAEEMAGESGDFVAETGRHVARRLLRETEW